MLRHYRPATVLCMVLLTAPFSMAAQQAENPEPHRFLTPIRVLPGIEHAGNRYRITLLRPSSPPPEHGYPVLYFLDGNAVEQDIEAGRFRPQEVSSPVALVLVGYETEQRFEVMARAYDYTPAFAPGTTETDPLDARRRTGGAAHFLDFLTETVKPAVHAMIPVDARKTGIWGHSYGGLFVLHALLNHPGTFQCHIAASPSIWWHEGQWLQRQKERLSTRPPGPMKLLITRGTAESAQKAPSGDMRVDAGRKARAQTPSTALPHFADRLGSLPDARVSYLEFDGLGHAEALTSSLLPALHWFAECAAKQDQD